MPLLGHFPSCPGQSITKSRRPECCFPALGPIWYPGPGRGRGGGVLPHLSGAARSCAGQRAGPQAPGHPSPPWQRHCCEKLLSRRPALRARARARHPRPHTPHDQSTSGWTLFHLLTSQSTQTNMKVWTEPPRGQEASEPAPSPAPHQTPQPHPHCGHLSLHVHGRLPGRCPAPGRRCSGPAPTRTQGRPGRAGAHGPWPEGLGPERGARSPVKTEH